eukprot:7106071-Pyramimonas_sp.AAC.1
MGPPAARRAPRAQRGCPLSWRPLGRRPLGPGRARWRRDCRVVGGGGRAYGGPCLCRSWEVCARGRLNAPPN